MIISSLLDTDFYKFTMWQAFYHQFPTLQARYSFKCRNKKDIGYLKESVEEQLDHLCTLRFQPDELEYLSRWFMKPDFIEYLRTFQFNREQVSVENVNGDLKIEIDGPVIQTIGFEVPILAIVSELFYEHKVNKQASNLLHKKINWLRATLPRFKFADFGTRRRYHRNLQALVVMSLAINLPEHFVGTSNVWFAKLFGLKPIGTMAHEWIMAGQGLSGVSLRHSQYYMLQAWVNEYRGALGIALSDTLGIDAFLQDFDLYFAKLFDGVRLDSGDPKVSGDKVIGHYKKLGIDPMTKWIIPSDSLDFVKAQELQKYFQDRINVSFGIGTYLTNDTGQEPLNIVIKPTYFNGRSVAKISDSPGKLMCDDQNYVALLKKCFNIK